MWSMAPVDYKHHARPSLIQALPFRLANRYEPAFEGLVRMHIARDMLREEDRDRGKGVKALVRSSIQRLGEMERGKEKWCYTKKHSLEVAYFSYILASEAQEHLIPGARDTPPPMAFAGGLIHDIGKTFLPLALVVKELGVDLVLFCLFEGARMNDVERRVLRDEHISAGTRFVRLFGNGESVKPMLDMVGLHHVMYDGYDTAFPSYPSQMKGVELPFNSRLAKTADFLSAVLPRHYRNGQWVESMRDSLGYAVAVAGWELDPLIVRCALTGLHGVSADEADSLIRRLALPKHEAWGQAIIRDFRATRSYVKDKIERDEQFRLMLLRRDIDKEEMYKQEADICAQELNVPTLLHLPR
jgi:hypothetical protein